MRRCEYKNFLSFSVASISSFLSPSRSAISRSAFSRIIIDRRKVVIFQHAARGFHMASMSTTVCLMEPNTAMTSGMKSANRKAAVNLAAERVAARRGGGSY